MNKSPLKAENNTTQEEDEGKIEELVLQILGSYENNKSNLIPILQQVQQNFGYLPEQAMKKIAQHMGIPESSVFGVATFYAFFKLVPTGRNTIKLCRGTACHVRGGARILREVEKQLGINP
ncbi:MAG: NAD(P)H-dependent oxidoreductase subunit E, partial [Spirochaetota bacterium]|nr:NAD(P)H-dependent oxidoreductase subunit E [Spirochaetota bacterium]